MSYHGETIKDEALEKYTLGLMEDVVRHYHDRIEDDNVDKLIERGIAKQLVEWIPEKYTEVDIKAMIGSKYTSVVAEFMTDTQTMMVVVHEEVNSVENKKDTYRSRYNPIAGWNEDGTYDPTSQTEDFIFPNPRAGRGSKVETLPSGQGLDKVDEDISYFKQALRRTLNRPYSKERINAAMVAEVAEGLHDEPVQLGVSSRGAGTPAPEFDFTSVSGIDPARAMDWNRNTDNKQSSYYTIDMNAMKMKESILNAEKETMIASASKRLQELAEQVMFDGLVGTAGTEPTTNALTMNELQELQDKYKDWTCGTSGWSDEYTLTKWDIGMPSMNKDDLTWRVPAEMTWYNPYPLTAPKNNQLSVVSAMEEIEFTEADLDELVDLINEQISEKMKFA